MSGPEKTRNSYREPMHLHLLRHGRAENRAASGRDADRVLTTDGVAELRRVLELARNAGTRPTLILSSPLARAVQTAEIARQVLESPGPILGASSLVPSGSPQLIWDELRLHSSEPDVLAVGHEPLLSQMVAWLVGSSRAMMQFPPAGMARFEIDASSTEGAGTLEWMITPDLIT